MMTCALHVLHFLRRDLQGIRHAVEAEFTGLTISTRQKQCCDLLLDRWNMQLSVYHLDAQSDGCFHIFFLPWRHESDSGTSGSLGIYLAIDPEKNSPNLINGYMQEEIRYSKGNFSGEDV